MLIALDINVIAIYNKFESSLKKAKLPRGNGAKPRVISPSEFSPNFGEIDSRAAREDTDR